MNQQTKAKHNLGTGNNYISVFTKLRCKHYVGNKMFDA